MEKIKQNIIFPLKQPPKGMPIPNTYTDMNPDAISSSMRFINIRFRNHYIANIKNTLHCLLDKIEQDSVPLNHYFPTWISNGESINNFKPGLFPVMRVNIKWNWSSLSGPRASSAWMRVWCLQLSSRILNPNSGSTNTWKIQTLLILYKNFNQNTEEKSLYTKRFLRLTRQWSSANESRFQKAGKIAI